jgi:hypothetical protein
MERLLSYKSACLRMCERIFLITRFSKKTNLGAEMEILELADWGIGFVQVKTGVPA